MPRKQVEQPVARLGWLLAGEFTVDGAGPNRLAAEATVAQVRELGRVELVDAALIAGFEMLAEAVDADPTNAALWGQYRAAEVALRGLGVSADDDAFAKLLAGLASDLDAEVAEPKNPRGSRRKDVGGAGPAVHAVAKPRRRSDRGAAS